MKTPSAIIIGSGIAGLTTAFKLQAIGYDVTVLEVGKRAGGAMYSHSENGWLAEYGPNTILETHSSIKELVRDLGLEKEKIYPNTKAGKRFIVKGGVPLPLPMSPLSFFASTFFSWKSKIRILREPFTAKGDNEYEESLEQFVRRRLGQEILDYALNPFVAGVYAGDPEKLSTKHAFPKIYQLEQEYGSIIKGQIKKAGKASVGGNIPRNKAKMFSFRRGLKTLTEKLAASLHYPVQFNTNIKRLIKSESGWQLTTAQNGGEKIWECDQIIYACPAHQLQTLGIRNRSKLDLSFSGNIYHPPVAVLTIGFKKSQVKHPLDGFGILVPEVEKLNILGVLFMSSLFPERAPTDCVALTVFIGGTRQPQLAMESEEKRLEVAINDLKKLLQVEGKPQFIFQKQWEKAIPQYNLGYGEIKTQFDSLENDNPGLYFTGNYRAGISVGDTILHSLQTVDKINSAENN